MSPAVAPSAALHGNKTTTVAAALVAATLVSVRSGKCTMPLVLLAAQRLRFLLSPAVTVLFTAGTASLLNGAADTKISLKGKLLHREVKELFFY